jgi:cytochrome c biogenesis protein CcdA
MEYFFISFIAGILTVLAPCVFTLLPVILGGSLTGNHWKKPATIIASLSASIFVFTLILKASTLLINIHPDFWKYLSGGILIVFGGITLFPNIWDKLSTRFKLSANSDKLLHKGVQRDGFIGDILIGAALGPVFSSCSPTYAIIIATILPQEPLIGIVNLIIYILGLALVLSLISIFGQRLIKNTKWAVNPHGKFKKLVGVIFILVGLAVFTGFDKSLETFLLDRGILDATQLEIQLLEERL